jgi:AraC family transcriptional regulator, ethanolamine operon transcriptional activator
MPADTADYLDFEITDAESYSAVVRGADMEIAQLEPGPLRGHHLRVGLPGGGASWIVTNLPLRGRGRFPSDVWTLSVVARTSSRSLQHGVEVRTGSLFYHRPGAEHDGLYGRDFSVVCLYIRQELFADTVSTQFPEVSDLLAEQWRLFEPAEVRRRELIAQFELAAITLQTDEKVRRSIAAKSVIQDELLAAFLDALAEGVTPAPMPTASHAAALVRRAEELARELAIKADGQPLSVRDLCLGCGVPRRTLNHAFHHVLNMGPVTYLRRLRLNQVRRLLQTPGASGEPKSVTEIALDHGFWHLGRFSSQYRELFGKLPSELARRGEM